MTFFVIPVNAGIQATIISTDIKIYSENNISLFLFLCFFILLHVIACNNYYIGLDPRVREDDKTYALD